MPFCVNVPHNTQSRMSDPTFRLSYHGRNLDITLYGVGLQRKSSTENCQGYHRWPFRHPIEFKLYNQKKYIKYIAGTHLYIITQISLYNYTFRPCILVIIRLYYKLNKKLYNMCVGYSGGNEISSYNTGWHGLWVTVDRC